MSPQIKAWGREIKRLFTPLPDAIQELKRRQSDSKLKEAVLSYLNNDIPEPFMNGPIFYLGRHVATPSFETLRFIELTQPYGLPIVVGQDTKDIFVSNNSMKRALGKMSVLKGITRTSDEIYENFTIVQFDAVQGHEFNTIQTKFGMNIVDFHTTLLREIYPTGVQISDESEWIDRNHRGNLIEHYKRILSLFIVHGIAFETLIPEDHEFTETILKPAFKEVEEHFGVRPLVCELLDLNTAMEKNWDAYPSVLYAFIKSHLS